MSTGRKIHLKGFKIDKTGKPLKSSTGKSVSQRIAERKRPKMKPRGIIMKLTHAVLAATLFISTFGSAKAADLAKPQPAPAAVEDVAPAKSVWTGLYIEGGLGITSSTVDAGPIGGPTLLSIGDSAISGHVGIGYDHMLMPHIVVGLLARAEMSDLSYSVFSEKLAKRDLEYMVGGRIGFVPRSDWMIYGLGGYRYSNLDIVQQPNSKQNGWVVGAGLEAMMTDHVFVGLEYTANLSKRDAVPGLAWFETADHTGKARIGFKF